MVIKPLDEAKPALLPSIPTDPMTTTATAASTLVRRSNEQPLSPIAKPLSVTADIQTLGQAGPLEVIAWFRAHGAKAGFLYMAPLHPRTSNEHHAYNLHVVPHDAIDPRDFYTISAGGITHVVNGISNLTELDRWEREFEQFTRIRRSPLFAKFRMWKAYCIWRLEVVRGKRTEHTETLTRGLFTVDASLQPALLAIRNLCLDVVELRLCHVDSERTYTLTEFIDAQRAQLDKVLARLQTFREELKAIALRACHLAMARAGFGDAESSPASPIADAAITAATTALSATLKKATGATSPSIVAAASSDTSEDGMSYTAQARKRAQCVRTASFLRLVDLLISGAMQALSVESVGFLRSYLSNREQTGLLKADEKAALAAAAAAAATAAATAKTTGTTERQRANSIHESHSTESVTSQTSTTSTRAKTEEIPIVTTVAIADGSEFAVRRIVKRRAVQTFSRHAAAGQDDAKSQPLLKARARSSDRVFPAPCLCLCLCLCLCVRDHRPLLSLSCLPPLTPPSSVLPRATVHLFLSLSLFSLFIALILSSCLSPD